MSKPIRCPGCNRLIIVDVTNKFDIDYSSNLIREIEEYDQFPPFLLEHKCKYCKSMSSLYAWNNNEDGGIEYG